MIVQYKKIFFQPISDIFLKKFKCIMTPSLARALTGRAYSAIYGHFFYKNAMNFQKLLKFNSFSKIFFK